MQLAFCTGKRKSDYGAKFYSSSPSKVWQIKTNHFFKRPAFIANESFSGLHSTPGFKPFSYLKEQIEI